MDTTGLVFPRGNDVVVTARFPDISDGTGMVSELYTKPSRETPDNDPAVKVYDSDVVNDPDNPGATISHFDVPSEDTGVTGAVWWRVDCVDVLGNRRTPEGACGTLLVEAV